jgi:hypothetical protein
MITMGEFLTIFGFKNWRFSQILCFNPLSALKNIVLSENRQFLPFRA